MATAIVLCSVRTDYTRFTETYLIISRAVAHVFGRRPLTAENRVRSQASQCEISGRQNYTRTGGFLPPPHPPCTSVFRAQYLFINAPYPLTPSFYSYQDKWAKCGNLRTKPCGFEHRGSVGQISTFPLQTRCKCHLRSSGDLSSVEW